MGETVTLVFVLVFVVAGGWQIGQWLGHLLLLACCWSHRPRRQDWSPEEIYKQEG